MSSNHPITSHLLTLIQQQGPLSFYEYMNLVLYHPRYGYYQNTQPKFGPEGDFITAPMLSPLFAYCLANQCQSVLESIHPSSMLELGAGNGLLASQMLSRLTTLGRLPEQYFILELSGILQQQQQALLKQTVPHYYPRIQWLNTLPQAFNGIILANEVLDAIPCHRFKYSSERIEEQFVRINDDQQLSNYYDTPRNPQLSEAVQQLKLSTQPYESEIQLALPGWINSLADCLNQGVILLIDYGFPQHELYHPERNQGTLMCHTQHHTHADPFHNPGLQDITCHVDFSSLAQAGLAAGLQLAGYTSQGAFLIGCGLTSLATEMQQTLDEKAWYNCSQAIKCLTLAHEMGELFKAIAFAKRFDSPLIGFDFQDQRQRLFLN